MLIIINIICIYFLNPNHRPDPEPFALILLANMQADGTIWPWTILTDDDTVQVLHFGLHCVALVNDCSTRQAWTQNARHKYRRSEETLYGKSTNRWGSKSRRSLSQGKQIQSGDKESNPISTPLTFLWTCVWFIVLLFIICNKLKYSYWPAAFCYCSAMTQCM